MFPKGETQRKRINAVRRKRRLIDAAESAKVRERSGGRCEARIGRVRCHARAVHVHHRLAGIGVRGRGASALADNKLHLCLRCHWLAHGRAD